MIQIALCVIALIFCQCKGNVSSEINSSSNSAISESEFVPHVRIITSTFNESYGPLQKQIFEGSQHYCNDSSCPDSLNDSFRYFRHCRCDKDCIEFRDCCSDSEYYNEKEQRKSMDYECHYVGNYGYFIKRTCVSSWDDAEIKENCLMSTKHDLDTDYIELRSPVTSTLTNITYGNIFCALCNHELDNIQSWNISSAECVMTMLTNSSISHSQKTTLTGSVTRNLEFDGKNWFYEDKSVRYDCSLILKPPINVKVHRCSYNYVPPISSCPDNWTDSNITRQCENTHLLVYDFKGKSYRNKFCAYCNGLDDYGLKCDFFNPAFQYDEELFNISSSAPRPFTILFDFKLKSDSKICNDTVKSYQKLREKFCPTETEMSSSVSTKLENWFLSGYTSLAISLSLIFLIIHLIIFSVVEELHTLAGKNLASFCVALVIAYGSFLLGNYVQDDLCYITSVTMYYSFLSAFLWMLAISYDMWKTFWNATKNFRSPKNMKKTFVMYSIWAWSMPLLPSFTTVYLDFAFTKSVLAPHFANNGCWFDNGVSLLLFFVAPVCTIIVTNFFFFIHTSCMLHSSQCESVNQKSRVDFKLYARIALLTGFTWITGFVAGYMQNLIIWFVFVLLNTAQGVFIFSAFSCKKRIVRSFLRRIGKFETWQRSLEVSNVKSTQVMSTTNH